MIATELAYEVSFSQFRIINAMTSTLLQGKSEPSRANNGSPNTSLDSLPCSTTVDRWNWSARSSNVGGGGIGKVVAD